MTVICNACLIPKSTDEFSKDARKKSGCQAYCKECAAAKIKKWRQLHKEHHRSVQKAWEALHPERHLKNKLGITLADKRSIFESQGRVCAACKSIEHRNPRNHGEHGWCVDHNHSTGEVRGVLCWTCNVVLGLAMESKERLLGLAQYLNTRNAGLGISHERTCEGALGIPAALTVGRFKGDA